MSITKKFFLSLGAAIIGGSSVLGFASQASALPVKAGPIWNNQDAKVKCPIAAQVYNAKWNGSWRTTETGKMSVCGTDAKYLPPLSGNVFAGPIWSNQDAKKKCPVAAAAANGSWNGQWATVVNGKMSVCGVK